MKRRFIKTLAVAFAVIASFIAPTANVFADDEKPAIWLQISPVAKRFKLDPKAELTEKVNIDNIGSKKFKFRVYAAPYSISNSAYEANFEKESNRTQISRWISFNQNTSAKKDSEKQWKKEVVFELEPDQRQEIEYKISIPANIPAGGQYATIFAESIPEDNVATTGVRTVSRVGMILYGNTTGDTVEKAELKNFTMKSVLGSGKITAEVDIANQGNTDFNATISMKIDKVIGGTVAEVTSPYQVIPDSPDRHAVLEWEDTPMFGIFKVKTTITALDQKIEEEKIVLVLPVFIVVIMLVLLTIIIAWLIILIRKRRAEKSRLIV